jgi:hypothetical protein
MTTCDADASGSEVATYAVYTKRGPVMLCDHHLRVHLLVIMATGLPVVPVSPLIEPADYYRKDSWWS